MGFPYTIRSGDTLTSIARRNGLASWRDLYYLPENATFRTKRPNPDRIFPGDVLMIPGNASTPIVEQVTGPEMVAAFLTLSHTRQRIVDIAKAEADLGHAPFGTVTDRLTDPGNRNFRYGWRRLREFFDVAVLGWGPAQWADPTKRTFVVQGKSFLVTNREGIQLPGMRIPRATVETASSGAASSPHGWCFAPLEAGWSFSGGWGLEWSGQP